MEKCEICRFFVAGNIMTGNSCLRLTAEAQKDGGILDVRMDVMASVEKIEVKPAFGCILFEARTE